MDFYFNEICYVRIEIYPKEFKFVVSSNNLRIIYVLCNWILPKETLDEDTVS